jgi:hypothetical protein
MVKAVGSTYYPCGYLNNYVMTSPLLKTVGTTYQRDGNGGKRSHKFLEIFIFLFILWNVLIMQNVILKVVDIQIK